MAVEPTAPAGHGKQVPSRASVPLESETIGEIKNRIESLIDKDFKLETSEQTSVLDSANRLFDGVQNTVFGDRGDLVELKIEKNALGNPILTTTKTNIPLATGAEASKPTITVTSIPFRPLLAESNLVVLDSPIGEVEKEEEPDLRRFNVFSLSKRCGALYIECRGVEVRGRRIKIGAAERMESSEALACSKKSLESTDPQSLRLAEEFKFTNLEIPYLGKLAIAKASSPAQSQALHTLRKAISSGALVETKLGHIDGPTQSQGTRRAGKVMVLGKVPNAAILVYSSPSKSLQGAPHEVLFDVSKSTAKTDPVQSPYGRSLYGGDSYGGPGPGNFYAPAAGGFSHTIASILDTLVQVE